MASSLHVLYVDGAEKGVPTNVESTLDVEDVSSFAPQATIDVYEGPNNTTGPLDVLSAIVSHDHAQVISISWGNCEAQDGGSQVAAVEANLFEEAAAQGQTVVAASGDNGSTDCGPPQRHPGPGRRRGRPRQPAVCDQRRRHVAGNARPASHRDRLEQLRRCQRRWHLVELGDACLPVGCLTGARGDQVVLLGPAVRRADRLLPGGSRRLGRRRPDHRPRDRLGRLGRLDVVGGTSLAAPLWAALVALTDAWPACSAHPVGFLNPALYSIAGRSGYASALNDVTRGSNHLASIPNWWRYPATVGYDLASGLGTPDAANPSGGGLVAQLCALPESGGVQYASPTKSSVTASQHSVDRGSHVVLHDHGQLAHAVRATRCRQASVARRDHDATSCHEDEDQTNIEYHQWEGRGDLRSERHRDSDGHLPRAPISPTESCCTRR